MFFGGTDGAFENGKRTRRGARPGDGLVAGVGSRSHADAATHGISQTLDGDGFGPDRLIAEILPVAAGEGRYPMCAAHPTMEWDTAAGDAVLRAAGGSVETWNGEKLRYGKPGFKNPAFVAYGRR